MVELTPELIKDLSKTRNGFYSWDYVAGLAVWIIGVEANNERLQARVQELEQERRWIPVRDYPSQVGWYRVITNNGTEQIREYVREPDRDIHYWDVKDGEWIMMYTNPPLPQPPQEGE